MSPQRRARTRGSFSRARRRPASPRRRGGRRGSVGPCGSDTKAQAGAPRAKAPPGGIEISLRKFSFEPAWPIGSYGAGMPAAPTRNFSFICGQDDFLVGRMGRKRFDELSGETPDEFSQEVVSGFAANVDDVEAAVNRFREAVQTMPMFGGRRVVWLKDVNFLADSVTGKAESTLGRVEDLQQLLQSVDPAETAVLVTAAPVDRRRTFGGAAG